MFAIAEFKKLKRIIEFQQIKLFSFVSASFMCEGMAIANVLQNVTCPKKNDNVTETEQLLPGTVQVSYQDLFEYCLLFTFKVYISLHDLLKYVNSLRLDAI